MKKGLTERGQKWICNAPTRREKERWVESKRLKHEYLPNAVKKV